MKETLLYSIGYNIGSCWETAKNGTSGWTARLWPSASPISSCLLPPRPAASWCWAVLQGQRSFYSNSQFLYGYSALQISHKASARSICFEVIALHPACSMETAGQEDQQCCLLSSIFQVPGFLSATPPLTHLALPITELSWVLCICSKKMSFNPRSYYKPQNGMKIWQNILFGPIDVK